jgi:hypothetical protein
MDFFADDKIWQCVGVILIVVAVAMGDFKQSSGCLASGLHLFIRLAMIGAGISIIVSHC